MIPVRYTQEMIDRYVREGLWGHPSTADLWDRNAELYPDREAVVDARHLSLRREPRSAGFLLEATLSGESRADWVFVYSTDGDPPELPGVRCERTDRGWVLWDSGAEGVDRVLVGLGARLLGPA